MFFLIASILSSLSILVFFKLFKRLKIENDTAIIVNYLVAAVLGFIVYEKEVSVSNIIASAWLPYALVLGVFFVAGFLFFALSTQKAGLAITSVFANISVVVPVIAAIILYNESLGIFKLSGIILALFAIYLIFKPRKNHKIKFEELIFPIGLFVVNGLNNTLMKHSEHNSAAVDAMIFLSVIFAVAFVVSILYFIISKNTKKPSIRSVLGGILLGVLNLYSTYFILKALTYFDSSVVYPVYNLGYISAAALVGYFIFREKLSKYNWIGVFIATVAIVLISYAINS